MSDRRELMWVGTIASYSDYFFRLTEKGGVWNTDCYYRRSRDGASWQPCSTHPVHQLVLAEYERTKSVEAD